MSAGNRYLSLDALRGLSIFGMVFSAIVPGNFVLPKWMYHIFPSPGWSKGMAFPVGISWVDLVLPIFVFCMGVAIPLSGRRKLERGMSGGRFVLEILERTFMLWLFSYLYVFLSFNSARPETGFTQFLTVLGFAALFPIYLVLPDNPRGRWVRLLGVVWAGVLMYFNATEFGKVMTVGSRGMIIFLLSGVYLTGALTWFFTRDSLRWRLGAFAVYVAFMAVLTGTGVSEMLGLHKTVKAFFDFEFFFFQLLLVPATYVGDLLYRRVIVQKEVDVIPAGSRAQFWFFPALAALTVWECYAFYERLVWVHVAVSGAALLGLGLAVRRYFPKYMELFLPAAAGLLLGILIDPFEGIKKVPCTISYCFVTFGLGVFLLMFMDFVCRYAGRSYAVRLFTGAGSNPLMSYIAHTSFTMPVLKLTGLIVLYQAAYKSGMNPWIGVGRSAVVVLITMGLVAWLSERKIFWKA